MGSAPRSTIAARGRPCGAGGWWLTRRNGGSASAAQSNEQDRAAPNTPVMPSGELSSANPRNGPSPDDRAIAAPDQPAPAPLREAGTMPMMAPARAVAVTPKARPFSTRTTTRAASDQAAK